MIGVGSDKAGGEWRGALIDLDGTLVDSNWLHVIAWQRALRQLGHDFTAAEIHPLIGMRGDQMLERLCVPDGDHGELQQGWVEAYSQLIPDVAILPGAKQLLVTLRHQQLTIAIATSGPQEVVEPVLRLLDADDLIDTVVNADDVAASKPAPDIFQHAARALHLDPSETVIIGDTVWDAQAGAAAEITVIGVLSGGTSERSLRTAGASAVYPTADALVTALLNAGQYSL